MQNLLYDWTGAGASQRRMRLCATQLARGVVGKSHRRRWGGVLSSSGPLGGGYMECPQIFCRDSSYGYTWTIQPKIEGIKVPPASAQASGVKLNRPGQTWSNRPWGAGPSPACKD